jgi:hypothetical protein
MPRKIRQLKADLRRAGAYRARQEGSHERWKHPLLPPSEGITLAGKNGSDALPYQEKEVRDFLRRIEELRRTHGNDE